ncbi:MAG TPA: hypothetical protein VI980_12055 [Acidimicrobiia bacterium]|nr:hypothetical protein [Acidimicrobiia bacterium]
MKQQGERIAIGVMVVGAAGPLGHVIVGPTIIPPAVALVGLLIAAIAGTHVLMTQR